jgi:dCTP diphosphatase
MALICERNDSPALCDELTAFIAEREWAQFRSPVNLATSVSSEAGNFECFRWIAKRTRRE